MAKEERNAIEEINQLSGSVIAHDDLLVHISKILIASGAIDCDGLQEIVETMEETASYPEEIMVDYKGTLEKFRDGLTGAI